MHTNTAPYFLKLTSLFYENIHQSAYIKRYAYNETLYKQGDAPRNLYIYISGSLKVCDETQRNINCSVGECIGAQANFANICYLETIKFSSPGEVLVIRFDSFKQKLLQHPTVFKEVIESLTRKQKVVTNILDKNLLHCLQQAI